MLANIKDPNERAAMNFWAEVGSIDKDAGFEIAQLVKDHTAVWGRIDQGLGYLEGIARQMPRAIETMNRAVTGLAAFRLELAKNGGDVQAAMRYGQETINNTQGLYSNTNAPPIFNHPLLRLSLQFKKYGHMMYFLLGQAVGKAFKGQDRATRIEGMKTLAYISATHVAMAGALGLPTEPFKLMLMGAKGLGLTAVGWDDVERWEREALAGVFGKTGGEVAAKGLPRLLGLDVSSRMGADSFLLHGQPRTGKENDVKAYLWNMAAGAPGGLVFEQISGIGDIMAGDPMKGFEKVVPLKGLADSIKAYRLGTEGKKSESGRQLEEPIGVPAAIAQAIGFTPASVAESGAHAFAIRSQATKGKGQRDKLIAEWVSAKPADKASAFKAVQKYNVSAHKDLRILPKDLTTAAKRRVSQGVGVITDKRSEHLRQRYDEVYNVR
jgi:hypothetical protein